MSTEQPPQPSAPSDIVAAASRAVIEVFGLVARQLPDPIQPPTPDNPVPQLTADMIRQLQAQLRRALGRLDPAGREDLE